MEAESLHTYSHQEREISVSSPLCLVSQQEQVTSYQSPGEKTCLIALYIYKLEEPTLVKIPFQGSINDYLSRINASVMSMLTKLNAPYSCEVVSEMVANFIHADFRQPSIIITDEGRTLIFSDKGCGFSAPNEEVIKLGFSSASIQQKKYIRGIGVGLTIVTSFIKDHQGTLSLEGNLNGGTVVTLSIPKELPKKTSGFSQATDITDSVEDNNIPYYHLSQRQKLVLKLVGKAPGIGPSTVSDLLDIALSTAYRNLIHLETINLITARDGKRALTQLGCNYLTLLEEGEQLDRN